MHILHSAISNEVTRDWQDINYQITPKNLMYPIFLTEDENEIEPIEAMPGISRHGINRLKEHLEPLAAKGLHSILLFGVITSLPKDNMGLHADSPQNPVINAIPIIRKWFPDVLIACDVCLCPYTSHGHCGILQSNGSINNPASIKRIAEVALAYAKAGAHVVAPSDMMDGRIGVIKEELITNNLAHVAVLSYTAKFASVFYGPFRDAAKSKPAFGDRKCYQLPSGASGLAKRAASRDVEEGADMLMIKPALAYLDIVRQTKDAHPEYPLFVYQVSGEYSMIYNAARSGAFDLKAAVCEALISMRRAGADVIISYFTPVVLDWLCLRSKI
ncbi:hypothetical protein RN001_004472 [Aquatica leii]|uniref:Delta-aminolevulinic acid dehydratase n=1 Tax=Aquatica leii TaxID=1421715 RepID=A0AAN7PBN4_9COLE|nr:hypothetical protein RN001_004472 [Aquatica leii]